MIRKFFNWIFASELQQLNEQIRLSKEELERTKNMQGILNKLLKDIDVSVDVHQYRGARSWAVVSLQGEKTDYIKFIDLGSAELREIQTFLSQFDRSERIKVDVSPEASGFLRIKNRNRHY